MTTKQAIETFSASLRARNVPHNTTKSYAHDLRQFLTAVPAELGAVTVESLQQFLEQQSHLSPATRSRRYSTLCAFYHWCVKQELVQQNPMERLDPIIQPKREPRPLADEEVLKIFGAIPKSALRDRTLFMLLYETGIRVGEALERERTVMLTAAPESIRLLCRHLKQSGITAGSIFRGDPRYGGSTLPLDYTVVHKAWQKYCRAAGVEGTIHQLRHARASQLIVAGVPLTTVRKQMGHRNLQSTLLYAEVDQATVKHDLLEYQRRRGRRIRSNG